MIQTSTSKLYETATKLKKDQFPDPDSYRDAEPSKNVINNILNFSKNLEVKPSRFVDFIEVIKS